MNDFDNKGCAVIFFGSIVYVAAGVVCVIIDDELYESRVFWFVLCGVAFTIAITILIVSRLRRKEINELKQESVKCKQEIISLHQTERRIEKDLVEKESLLNKYINLNNAKNAIYELVKKKDEKSIRAFANLYADHLLLQYDISINHLCTKSHPAYKEALRIREIKQKDKKYIAEFKIMQYKFDHIVALFPELSEYIEDLTTINEEAATIDDIQEEYDRVRDWVSDTEYKALSLSERNQLALDKYLQRTKSNSEIGKEYELYCGYKLLKHGYRVEQFGVEKGLNDLGRDIIAQKNGAIYIIQCKCWSKTKEIREKYIAQLYGTTAMYCVENKDILPLLKIGKNVFPVFVTTTRLSEKASEFARYLGVVVRVWAFEDFPRIKCNINGDSKIYHLPFDQQYGSSKIINKGEFMAWTVKEAELAGFRRAYRWKGISLNT